MNQRQSQSQQSRSLLPFLALFLLALSIAPEAAKADDHGAPTAPTPPNCKIVKGNYSSNPLPPEACFSPVGFCTAGQLTGDFRGQYSFVMRQAIPAGEPTAPGATFYTGTSVILIQAGSLVGTDTGTVDLNPFGTGRQAALITLTAGADGLEGSSGYLSLIGAMNFSTGEVLGRYEGQVCGPQFGQGHDDHHEDDHAEPHEDLQGGTPDAGAEGPSSQAPGGDASQG